MIMLLINSLHTNRLFLFIVYNVHMEECAHHHLKYIVYRQMPPTPSLTSQRLILIDVLIP